MIDALGDTLPHPLCCQHEFTSTSASTLGKNAKPATYLIDKILETNSHGILFGQSMAFKSFVALEMAACISEGKPFLGNTCYQQGKVVYMCGEGLGGLSRRIKAIQLEKDWNLSNLYILDRRVVIDSDTNMKAFKEALDEISPELIVFDTFSSLAINTDEQSNSQVAQGVSISPKDM